MTARGRYCRFCCAFVPGVGVEHRATSQHRDAVRLAKEARFWSRVDVTLGPEGCWPWTGSRDSQGYGRVHFHGQHPAHRVAYTLARGPIPPGRQVDHLCRRSDCVNPWHLEPVSPSENVQRGLNVRLRAWKRLRDRCRSGHDLTDPANVYLFPSRGRRACRPCTLARQRRAYRVKAA